MELNLDQWNNMKIVFVWWTLLVATDIAISVIRYDHTDGFIVLASYYWQQRKNCTFLSLASKHIK